MLAEQRTSRAALWMSGAAVVRALLALATQVVVARTFGAAESTDAFYVSFSIPQMVGDFLVGGTLFSAFIPIFVRTWKQVSEEEAWRLTNILSAILFLGLAGAAGLYALLAGPIVGLLAPGFDPVTHAEAAALARIVSPLFLLFGFSYVATGVLQSYRHFTTSALASLFLPVSMLVAVVSFGESHGIASLAGGALAGATLQCGTQWAAIALGSGKVRIVLPAWHPGLGEVARIMGPIMIGIVAVNANQIYQRHLASEAETGMVAALAFAQYFAALPVLLLMPLAQTAFPSLSTAHAEGDDEAFRNVLVRGLRIVGFLGLPVVCLLATLREPVIRVVLERGAFDARDTQLTADATLWLALGTVFMGANFIMARAHYSARKPWVPVGLNTGVVLVALPLNAWLLGRYGIAGLALNRAAFYAAFTVGCLVLTDRLLVRLPWGRLLWGWGRTAACAVAFVWPVRLIHRMSESWLPAGLVGEGLRLVAAGLVAVAIYLVGAWLLRLEEPGEIRRALRRRGEA